jgi:hypothetical protein
MKANSLQWLHTLNTAAAILQWKMFTNSLKLAGSRLIQPGLPAIHGDSQRLSGGSPKKPA